MNISGDIQSAIAPRRWSALPEAVALIALAWAVNRLAWSDDPAYVHSLFNAYLVAVILISGRYGVPAGLLTSALSVAAAATSYAGVDPSPGAYLAPATGGLTTVSLVAAALVVGGLATVHRRKLAATVAAFDRTHARIAALESEYGAAVEEKDIEERRVLADEGSFGAVVVLMDDLDRQDPAEIPARLLRAVRQLMNGGSAALYRVHAEGPLTIEHGDAARWPAALDPAREPVLAAALAKNGGASVATVRTDEERRPDRVLVAHPVSAHEDHYMLVATDLNFVAFARDRLSALEGCARIAGRAMERARLYAATHDRNVVDPATGACAFPFFRKRLAEEIALARRHAAPLCVLALEAASAPPAEVAAALKSALRDGDLVAHHRTPESFVLLLPFTPEPGARVVEQRLASALPHARLAVIPVDPHQDAVRDVLDRLEPRA